MLRFHVGSDRSGSDNVESQLHVDGSVSRCLKNGNEALNDSPHSSRRTCHAAQKSADATVG